MTKKKHVEPDHPATDFEVDTPDVEEPAPRASDPAPVLLSTAKPSDGDYRLVVALIDGHGHVRQSDLTMGAAALASLQNDLATGGRGSWDERLAPLLRTVLAQP